MAEERFGLLLLRLVVVTIGLGEAHDALAGGEEGVGGGGSGGVAAG